MLSPIEPESIKKASRIEIILAKLFGKKIVATEGGYQVTMYRWRGILYVTDFVKLPNF